MILDKNSTMGDQYYPRFGRKRHRLQTGVASERMQTRLCGNGRGDSNTGLLAGIKKSLGLHIEHAKGTSVGLGDVPQQKMDNCNCL